MGAGKLQQLAPVYGSGYLEGRMGGEVRTRPPLAPSQKPLRIVLYVLTAATALAALFLQPALSAAVSRGALGRPWLFLPIALFGTLFVTYGIDRWMLVRRRRYPAGRAFFQIAFGLVFGLLLLPSTLRDFKAQKVTTSERLLHHSDAQIRATAILAVGFKGADARGRLAVQHAIEDRHPAVREAAFRVLSRWSGIAVEDEAGLKLWAEGVSSSTTSTSTGRD